MKKSIMYAILIIILSFGSAWSSGLMFVASPYPDFYEGDIDTGYRIDTNGSDGVKKSINGLNINTPAPIVFIPQTCRSNADCALVITKVEFFVDNVLVNTETTYPYDLKFPTDSATAEVNDYFTNGYHVIKAVVTKVDNTTIDILAKFSWGSEDNIIHKVEDLTLFYFTSNNEITVGWDANVGDPDYEMKLWSVERKEFCLTAKTSLTSVKFKVPFTGHFYAYVRAVEKPFADSQKASINAATSLADLKALIPAACDLNDWWNDNATLNEMKTKLLEVDSQCSEWSKSNDKEIALVKQDDGTTINKGWWLYGYPAAPTGGSIE